MVDVERLEDEPDGLIHRDRHDRRLAGSAVNDGALLIVERPLPLEALDLDRGAWVVRASLDLAQGDHAEREEDEDDDGRNRGPDDLDGRVAVELFRQDVVARSAAVADDGVEDEALDADEHDEREPEDEEVEVEDVLPRLGGRLRREHAAGQQPEQQDGSRGASEYARRAPWRRSLHQVVSRGSWLDRDGGAERVRHAPAGGLTATRSAL